MISYPKPQYGHQVRAALREGRLCLREWIEGELERVARVDPAVHAFTTVTAERALKEAAVLQAMEPATRDALPLAGMTYTVKNLFDLKGVVTVAGSKVLRSQPPAQHDAFLVRKLKSAGAICLGAVNMGEFAYDFVTENQHDGVTRNPHDLGCSAGGSSGGSGAAVAAGLGSFSLGSDTNGSIRVPSSFCGVFGLKPTYGRLGRSGAFPFVASIDHLGPLARCATDLALVYDVLQGFDPHDAGYNDRPLEPSEPFLEEGVPRLRVGLLTGYFGEGGDPFVHEAARTVAKALGGSQTVEWPEAPLARAAGYLITAMEGGSLHLKRLRAEMDSFEPLTRDRLVAGLSMPSVWYTQAQKFRRWWSERTAETWRSFDIVVAPATPVTATQIGQPLISFRGETLPTRPNLGVFTQPISLAGLPVVAVPVHRPNGLPCAVQLIGAPWAEAILLQAARALEVAGVCHAASIDPVPPSI